MEKEFGEKNYKDYGKDAYNKIKIAKETEQADIFNGNYSLFRALSVAFLILSLAMVLLGYKYYSLIPFLFFVMALQRMIRFGKYYAKNVYRMYMLIANNDKEKTANL